MSPQLGENRQTHSGESIPPNSGEPVAVLNIANVLTLSRLVMVPIFLVVLFVAEGHDPLWRGIATAVFVLASLTDRIDGELARRRGLITDFGKIADPIADKALTGAALVGLSLIGELSWWITGLILGRELGITVLRFWVIRHGVIPASRGGKLKTLLQAIAIGLYLLPLEVLLGAGLRSAGWDANVALFTDSTRWVTMGAALAVTLLTGVDYLLRALKLRADAHAAGPSPESGTPEEAPPHGNEQGPRGVNQKGTSASLHQKEERRHSNHDETAY